MSRSSLKSCVRWGSISILVASLGCAASQPKLAATDDVSEPALVHASDVVADYPHGSVKIAPAGSLEGVSVKVREDSATFTGKGMSAVEIAGIAYGYPQCRVVAPYYEDSARFDVEVVVNGSQDYRTLLKSAIVARFPFRARPVRRSLPVYELTAPFGRVRPTAGKVLHEPLSTPEGRLRLSFTNSKLMSEFVDQLEFYLDRPVVDETGVIEPQEFDLEAEWQFVENRAAVVAEALYDQLGLRLVPATREVDVLLVEPNGFRY